MSVWVTGDIHGNPIRLSTENFYEQKEFSRNKNENTVIILGDFGLIWNRNGEDKQENDLNSCKCKNGIYYIYGLNSEVCKSIIVNKINTQMSYTNEQILSAKEMLKRLKNELLQEKQSLDIMLNT